MADIIELVIKQLKQTFGQEIKIYDEPIQQGTPTPCFFVRVSNRNQQRKLGDNVQQTAFVFITYYPHSEDKRGEMDSIISQLYNSRRWKYLDYKYQVNRLKASHNDEILTLSFSLIWEARFEVEEGDLIENVETRTTVN